MPDYRKLTDWNPKKGDVFETDDGSLCRAVSDTHARFDDWPVGWTDKPFGSFYHYYRLISRASDIEEQTATDDLHRAMREIAADLRGLSTKLDYATSRSERARAAKPKRETMTLWGYHDPGWRGGEWLFADRKVEADTHSITLPLIDGRLPAGEYRNANGDVITVEEL